MKEFCNIEWKDPDRDDMKFLSNANLKIKCNLNAFNLISQ